MLAGGYIANGKLDYDTTMAVLEAEARKIAPDEMAQNPKTIVSGLKNGMARPLEELKEEIEDTVETVEDRLGKIYYTILDVQNELDELYERGIAERREDDVQEYERPLHREAGCNNICVRSTV